MNEIIASGIASVLLTATVVAVLRPSNLAVGGRAWLLICSALSLTAVPNCFGWWQNIADRAVPRAEMPWVWPALVLTSFLTAAAALAFPTLFRVRFVERWKNRRPWRTEGRTFPFGYAEPPRRGGQGSGPERTAPAVVEDPPGPARGEKKGAACLQHWLDFVDFLPDATFVIDLTGKVIAWNRAIEKLTGIPKPEIFEQGGYAYSVPFYGDRRPLLIDLVSGRHPEIEQQYDFLLREGNSCTAECFAPGAFGGRGAYLRGTASVLFGEDGKPVGAVEFIRDISGSKQSDLALREKEERYRSIFEASRDPICITDREYRLVEVNRAAEDLFGYTCEEMIGMDFRKFCTDPGFLASFYAETEKNDSALDFQGGFRKSDGTQMHCILTATARKGADGVFLGSQGIIRDVTELKKLEQQFLQSQKMEAVGRLAGGVAHDFNNILTAIMGYAQLLVHRIDEESPLHRYVCEIDRAAGRAADLTRQLLAFSRRQVFQPTVVNLDALIEKMDNMLRRIIGEDILLHVVPNPHPGQVKADPGQVEQVIMNLVVNARDAMPRGGRLTIQSSNVDLDAEHFHRKIAVQPGPYVLLTVSDTGTGMDESVLPYVFEPFFTTKEPGKGTGLGLSTVYGIVKQSGGYVFADSEPAKGTVFRLYLPRVQEAVCSAGRPDPAPRHACTGETILVVEDEDAVRTLVRDALRDGGYTVLDASRGRDAVAAAEEYGEAIHLLLTDVVMPEMNGLELAKVLSPRRPEMKVLYMTGYADIDRQELQADVNLLRKPFTPDGLSRRVREILVGRSSGNEGETRQGGNAV